MTDEARARLRRYLEQRRELGESELVLDNLDVGEALRLLGAAGGPAAAAAARDAASVYDSVRRAVPRVVPGDARSPDTGEARADPSPLGEGSGGSSDWRSALRAAGAAPGDAARKPLASRAAEPAALKKDPVSMSSRRDSFDPAPDAPSMPSDGDLVGGLAAGTGTAGRIPEPIAGAPSVDAIADMTRSCTRCPLYQTATNAVPGEGNPSADFMVVGEAPGANEDETGRPFIGAAGQLLTKILGAINLQRDDVFIANVLKHRPPGNRNPKPDEVAACSPYLLRQIELVQPKVILALGTFAAQTLLETKLAIGKLRGQVHAYHGVPLIVTYHPAALLRNPAWKRPTWEDVQLARRVLDRAAGA